MKYKLSDCVEIVSGGTPKKSISEYWNGKIPWLTIKDFNLRYPKTVSGYITNEGLKNSSTRLSEDKDILISARGTVGEVMMIHSGYTFNQSIYGLRVKRKLAIPEYVYYWLIANKEMFSKNVHGSVFDTITRKTFDYIEIELPSIAKQNEIIRTLDSIDTKIELNYVINDNLGKLIDLDFNKTLGNNSLESVTINNLGSIIGGGTPSKKIAEYWNGDIPWITPKDLSKSKRLFTSSGNLWITNEGLEKSSAKILPIGTVLYSSRAPIGYISIADNPITTNQGFKSIVPNKDYSTEFIFELLKKETDNLINSANGSTFKEISGTQLKNHIVKIPTKLVCQQFSERVQPMFRIIRKLEQENFILLQIKELLLNKFF